MPDGEKWRGVRQFFKVLDRILLVGAIVFVVLLVLGVGFCLVAYGRA